MAQREQQAPIRRIVEMRLRRHQARDTITLRLDCRHEAEVEERRQGEET